MQGVGEACDHFIDATHGTGMIRFKVLLIFVIFSIFGCTDGVDDAASDTSRPSLSSTPVEVQILAISEFIGQLEPSTRDGVKVGGAELLGAYWRADASRYPNTLRLSAGDAFGSSSPLSSAFDELPTVLALGAMGLDVDTLTNHNFDRGLPHLQRMLDASAYEYVCANLTNVPQNIRGVSPYTVRDVGGVPVAVIGVMDVETPMRVFPGSFGTMTATDPASGVREAMALASEDGATLFVVLATVFNEEEDEGGALSALATEVEGIDLIVGEPRFEDESVAWRVGETLIVQAQRGGEDYARVVLEVVPSTGEVLSISAAADIFVEVVDDDAHDPDLEVKAVLDAYREQLQVEFDEVVATSVGVFDSDDARERSEETALGDLLADALRVSYEADFSFINGGSLRDSLPSDGYQVGDESLRRLGETTEVYDVVQGDVFAVLPFGNTVVVQTLSGARLWEAFEHDFAQLEEGSWGGFLQFSGLRVRYNPDGADGRRVCEITTMAGEAIPADETIYTMATNSYLAQGGDGYEMFTHDQGTTRDIVADVVTSYLRDRITDALDPAALVSGSADEARLIKDNTCAP